MPFRFKKSDASVEDGVRRMAAEQIDRAIASIDGEDAATAIHDVRKRCKKLRALTRLIRPAFPGYAQANAMFRDTARIVGPLRDATVMQDTYDALMERYGERVDRQRLGAVRRAFTLERQAMAGEIDAAAALAQCRERLAAAKESVAGWTLEETGFAAVRGGLKKTYRRARKAEARAQDGGDAEAFHQWRKAVKYHAHHCHILRPVAPRMLKARGALASDLGELLGDHHDLAVFSARLRESPGTFGPEASAEMMAGLAHERSARLARKAGHLGARLQAEKPGALANRLGKMWKEWAKGEKLDA